MFRKLWGKYKWRKLRKQVWQKRLLDQLELVSNQFPQAVRCSLDLSWGPFYGGAVLLNRKSTKARIQVQLPYDRYLTLDERQVMAKYNLNRNALPYFIFFHEYYHLIDALSHCRQDQDLKSYQAALARAARTNTPYRKLQIEARADEFAYRQYVRFLEAG